GPDAGPEGAPPPRCRIAVARDEAFCFYYADNLDALRAAGAEPVFFSPLRDGGLPRGVGGLYLGGGYPERYARALSDNRGMREQIARAVAGGLPTVAECGGFLSCNRPWRTRAGAPGPWRGPCRGGGLPPDGFSASAI